MALLYRHPVNAAYTSDRENREQNETGAFNVQGEAALAELPQSRGRLDVPGGRKRLPFDRAGGQTRHELALQQQEEEDDRQDA
jgi:hypothetical protein